MKKIVLLTAVISISLIVLTIFLMIPLEWKANLISPMSQKTSQKTGVDIISTPAPTSNTAQTIKFDKSTNLKEELEKINPQVLDSDFE
ncbi:hypothetical protein HY384_02910 [Candidatus Daviesbacteria bacterium]|nr:hypothetical protein [Candidatus Daviesbacteria bacterium]